jgi:hypothetical protein
MPLMILFLFLLSCSQSLNKEEIANSQVEKTFNSFTLSSPKASNINYQKAAQSIVAIFSASGSSGTGFFISEDGFLLTNAHVVKDFCTREECSNSLMFIRNFVQNGEMEKFTNFKILALNNALDFALIKINLPSNQKVSFLEIDLELKDSHHFKNEADLFIIGHLMGSQLRISPTELYDFENGYYLLNSGASPGNSGSPLVDSHTGKVVGIFNSRSFSEQAPNSFGKTISKAARMDLIYPLIENLIQESESKKSMFNFFSAHQETPDFSIPSKEKFNEQNPTNITALINQEIGKKDSDHNALKWIQNLSRHPYTNQNLSELVQNITYLELKTQKKLFNQSQNAQIFLEKILEIEKKQKAQKPELSFDQYSFFKIQYGLQNQSECLEVFKKIDRLSSLAKLYYYSSQCLSLTTPSNLDILDGLTIELEDPLYSHGDYLVENIVLMTLNQQLLLRESLSNEKRHQAKKTLNTLAQNTKRPIFFLNVEKQLLLLDSMPELLLKGGFAETIH